MLIGTRCLPTVSTCISLFRSLSLSHECASFAELPFTHIFCLHNVHLLNLHLSISHTHMPTRFLNVPSSPTLSYLHTRLPHSLSLSFFRSYASISRMFSLSLSLSCLQCVQIGRFFTVLNNTYYCISPRSNT